jgi:hypothetical protein
MQRQASIVVPRWLCAIGSALFAVAALYALAGVLQAASLFTGERALRNGNLWGSLFLVGLSASALLVAMAVRVQLGPLARKVAGALSLVLAVWAAWPVASHVLAADRCLDQGGSFNYVLGVCDESANHPALSLVVTHGFLLTLSALAGVATVLFFVSAYAGGRNAPSAL